MADEKTLRGYFQAQHICWIKSLRASQLLREPPGSPSYMPALFFFFAGQNPISFIIQYAFFED